jgi:hypothetical protein
MFIELTKARKDLRRYRRSVERNQRRIARELDRIQKDLDKIYPNPSIIAAHELLTDPDYAWNGDFDDLREPLAELILKINKAGLFPDDVDTISRILLSAPR